MLVICLKSSVVFLKTVSCLLLLHSCDKFIVVLSNHNDINNDNGNVIMVIVMIKVTIKIMCHACAFLFQCCLLKLPGY